jgi:hypothetical protein
MKFMTYLGEIHEISGVKTIKTGKFSPGGTGA